ncbi:MAG: VIT domain-containing protein, partial [Planctomycetota bacterium]
MNPEDDNRTEERLAALLASLGTDAAPPDRQVLARLRETSAEAFAAATSDQAQTPEGASPKGTVPFSLREDRDSPRENRDSPREDRDSPHETQVPSRRRRMFVIAMPISAAAAAAIAVVTCFWSATRADDAVEFGKVLENISEADTVHLKISRDGKAGQLWAKQAEQARPDRLRWNHPDGTYSIARGNRLWLVDEKANRATSRPSPYFREDQPGLDLLALLDLPAKDSRKSLLSARPKEQVKRDGRQCNVYRMEVAAREGEIRIEALVDTGTGMLRTLKTTTRRDGRVQPATVLDVLAVDKPVDESLFLVGDTLTEDGRVGKVTDVQGIVSIQPVMRRRWTPLATHMLLKPGDWVRTDVRGANAVAMRLVKETNVTLGPGSLVEVVKPGQVRVVHGVLKVVADAKAPVELLGPGQQKIQVKGTRIYRLEKEKLVRLDKAPLWLQGFEGATNNESIGSLIAKVEGRNEPLTVGYHRVSVDIRDQIARTVIEESFVNHTRNRLEGVFYFPLPQDASISGFGMWIGNDLVEADVVEKQRAREIYETILRERRDPGLLEWTGGNIFKARVFPIEAHSEKRIKITYTQVLPLNGGRYRYSYALRSELLKQNPLRELAIDVKLSSVMPLSEVTSPTHTARIDSTRHSAHVEFAAQEYTPTRDFEVVVDLAGSQSDVVLIPHRRGDDGYFMMLLTPPAGEGQWQREILPDDKPLELLILADTSGSIDADGREAQAAFIASLLASLTPEDKINLACCDVECNWAFKRAVSAKEENIKAARDFLAGRVSLGWTDLDRAFASVLAQCGPNTQVIYVGDGIVTTKDADPVAFGKRLKLLFQGKAATCHAVTLGSSFEPIVVKTIASLGGGSVRQIGGERTPRAVALELLAEMSKPAIRDLKVQFTGIRTARVYPETLPNLAAGTQQILLGRYLPEGRDQQGEVTVTGVQGDQPLRFHTRVSLKDAEQGNSFIPRLWARMHLDALLEQGASSVIKDEIIALSEEYHIMTPYTSLLVLESDADRERFKVKRRFQMRDAEAFFAEGRDKVDYELVQQQMRRAGNWRLGLRRGVLRELLGLGRDIRVFQPQQGPSRFNEYLGRVSTYGGSASGHAYTMPQGGPMTGELPMLSPYDGPLDHGAAETEDGRFALPGEELFADAKKADAEFDEDFESSEEYLGEPSFDGAERMLRQELAVEGGPELFARGPADSAPIAASGSYSSLGAYGKYPLGFGTRGRGSRSDRRGGLVASYVGNEAMPRESWPGRRTSWLAALFPHLPPAPQKEKPFKPEKPWPAEARDLAKGLLRTEQLAGLNGGLRIERQVEGFDPRWDRLSSRSQTIELVSPAAWLVRSGGYGSQTAVQWCDGQERGVFSKAFQLGRLRKSTPLDLSKPPLGLPGHVLTPLDRTYRNYTVELRPQADQRTLLVLKQRENPDSEVHILVDTARKVVLSIESRREGKVTSSTKFDQFVEIAGAWWGGRMQTLDQEGRRTSLLTQKFRLLATDAFDQQVKGQLAGRERVQFLREPRVELADAKRTFADGVATFDDRMTLLLHFCDSQQWSRVLEHLEQAEKLAAGKPGMRWVRNAILRDSRRREELRQRILDEAASVSKWMQSASTRFDSETLFLAGYLVGQSSSTLQANEMLALLDTLKPVYERQPEHLLAMKRWTQSRVNYLRQVGRPDEALQLQGQLAKDYPHDYRLQQQYAQALANVGEYDAAYAWLDRVITDEAQWRPHEEDYLRRTYTQLLQNQGRWPEMADYLARWVERNPETSTAYQQYLGALMRINEIDKANSLIAAWLKEGRQQGKLPPDVSCRLRAAVSQALGQGYGMRTNRIDEQWLDPLADTARFFARHETHSNVASPIMGHRQFQGT